MPFGFCFSFLACKPREDIVFKTFDNNFMRLNQAFTSPHRRLESRRAKLSDLSIRQREEIDYIGPSVSDTRNILAFRAPA